MIGLAWVPIQLLFGYGILKCISDIRSMIEAWGLGISINKTRSFCLKEVTRVRCMLSSSLSYNSLIPHTQPLTSSCEVVAKYVILLNFYHI